ncbi:MAG: rod shape-determining protein [Acidobacteriota bacterium]
MRIPLKAGMTGLGIDLGTINTLICDDHSRILLNEPSVVTMNHKTGEIEAVGLEARRMLGRTPGHLEVIMPLRDGVINYFDLTREMLRLFIRKACPGPRLMGTRLVICVPTETTQIERRAVRETGLALKASEVHVVEEPMAAACGTGFAVEQPRGGMIVDIGGGTTEIAVISFCGIVCSGSVRVGGSHMDEAIVQHIRRKHNMLIGYDTAEKLKHALGRADSSGKESEVMQIKGRDLVRRLPKIMSVTRCDVCEAISDQVSAILSAVRRTLERTPPELSADIKAEGITLTGGGAMLSGIASRIERETGIHVRVAPEPLLSVAMGAAYLLQDPSLLERVQIPYL